MTSPLGCGDVRSIAFAYYRTATRVLQAYACKGLRHASVADDAAAAEEEEEETVQHVGGALDTAGYGKTRLDTSERAIHAVAGWPCHRMIPVYTLRRDKMQLSIGLYQYAAAAANY